MKNIFVTSILILCFFLVGKAQKTVIIKGNIIGDLLGYNHVYIYGNGIKVDTAEIINGNFEFRVPFEKPIVPLFYTEYDVKKTRMYKISPILIDRPGTLNIKDIDITQGFSTGVVSGIKSAEDFQEFNNQEKQVTLEITKILKEKNSSASLKMGSPEMKAYQTALDSLRQLKLSVVIENFVKAHPDSYTSAYILSSTGLGLLKTNELERIHKLLSKNIQRSDAGIRITEYIQGIRNSVIGKQVEEFTLNSPEEKAISLSQFKGKYVLVDFWASWCGPCKQSFPHLKELYKKYKSNQFEIYSISIDKSKTDWLRELKNQNLPWVQSLDTKNIAISRFAVTAVPTTYLIDPKGNILLKEIGYEAKGGVIEKKIAELFENRDSK